jgi:LemA protein
MIVFVALALVVIGLPLLVFIAIFNGLVGKKNQVESVFSTVDVMLKKRYDLIPNLVETVKGYAAHERGVLEEIVKLREKALSGDVPLEQKVEIDSRLSRMLGGLMARVEAYPQLKASDNFMQLQRTLAEMEEQISAARRTFNAAVLEYNNAVQMFPGNIVASVMGYSARSFFEIDAEERGRVEVGNFQAGTSVK